MGNVIGAGPGQNPTRQAALFAGLPERVGAVTVNKVCGSKPTVIRFGKLVDGTGKVVVNALVIVKDDRILSVGAAGVAPSSSTTQC